MGNIKVKVIDNRSPQLETVIKLGDENIKTLSFFPEGAFRDKASKGLIIVALNNDNECIGYLMYDIVKTKNKIKLLHLCIDSNYRGQNIARQLFDFLKSRTQSSLGIFLECRRDYNIDRMWEKFGLIPLCERKAKTKDKVLTYWWFDFGHRNLFSFDYEKQLESKLCVVIDFDIFEKINLTEDGDNSESTGLLADWIDSSLSLYINDEIFNLINKIEDGDTRKYLIDRANNTDTIIYDRDNFNNALTELIEFCTKNNLSLTEYEIRYLAKVIVSDIVIFITSNKSLLDCGDKFFDRFKLSIKSPTEIIIQLEDLINDKPEYQPIRLAGTQLQQIQIEQGREKELEKYFIHDEKETSALFIQNLLRYTSDRNNFECNLIIQEEVPLALVVYGTNKEYELEVPLLRIKDCDLASTLAPHIIYEAVLCAVKNNKQFTIITDLYLQDVVIRSIEKDNFFKDNNSYFRANFALIETKDNIANFTNDLTSQLDSKYKCFNKIAQSLVKDSSTRSLLTLENYFFPLKISDADLPTFIIPIKPYWASQLFDEELANQTLFGATKIKLALNREAVYYKSKSGAKQLKPGIKGRIVWYISQDKDGGFNKMSSLIACSFLDEVIIGKPKDLYDRFRDLGIYQWNDIRELVKKDLEKDIMALKFNNTEIFDLPIPLTEVQQILENQNTIQSPVFIERNKFTIIYKRGLKR